MLRPQAAGAAELRVQLAAAPFVGGGGRRWRIRSGTGAAQADPAAVNTADPAGGGRGGAPCAVEHASFMNHAHHVLDDLI